MGVTDGSDVSPGEVGEFIRLGVGVMFTAAPQTQTVPVGVLSAGDWDVWAFIANVSVDINGISANLAPQPAGFTDSLWMKLDTGWGTNTVEGLNLVSPVARALTAQQSLIAFSVTTNSAAATVGPGAGSLDLIFCARRMR